MKTRAFLGAALLASVIADNALAQQQPSPVQPAPVTRTILQRADVPGTNLEIIYATVEIAPGFKTGRHSHPGIVMAQSLKASSGCTLTGSRRKCFARENP